MLTKQRYTICSYGAPWSVRDCTTLSGEPKPYRPLNTSPAGPCPSSLYAIRAPNLGCIRVNGKALHMVVTQRVPLPVKITLHTADEDRDADEIRDSAALPTPQLVVAIDGSCVVPRGSRRGGLAEHDCCKIFVMLQILISYEGRTRYSMAYYWYIF